MINERIIGTGAGANTVVPSEYFNTVLYTGNGGTQRVGGYINRGFISKPSTAGVEIPNVENLFLKKDTEFSVSLWFNGAPNAYAGEIFSDYATQSFTVFLNVNPSGYLQGSVRMNSTEVYITSSTTVNDGEWHNVVYTYKNSTSTIKMYLDGSLVGSNTIPSSSYYSSSGTNIKITAGSVYYPPSSSYSHGIDGVIDQLRIFNREVTSSEVTTLYEETHASTTISTTDIFSDGSGVALYQFDGNANDTGGVNGKFGAAAVFNGSSSYIDVPSGVRQNNNFSFSFWFNTNSTTLGQNPVVFRNGKKFQIGLNNSNVGNGSIRVNAGNNTNVDSATGIFSANTWYHLAVTQSSTGGVKVYLDGSVVASNSGATGDLVSVTGKDVLGAYYSTSYTGFFNGKMDDVRMYSDVLTSTEVGYLYNNTTASIPTDNLVAYYKLDGNALDSANSFDGTDSNVAYGFDGTASVSYQEATNFTPDLVWIKARNSSGGSNVLFDSVRGLTAPHFLASNLTNAEFGNATTGVTSFDSNGFTVGDDSNGGANVNGASGGLYSGNGTYVAWCFNAGTGAAASNTDGTITSTVKADAGFSIVKYTGNGNSSATVGHGLSSAPELLIAKSTSEANNWWTGVKDVNGVLQLDSTSSVISSGGTNGAIGIQSTYTSNVFGFLAGTSSVDNANKNGQNYIAYCFHSVDGIQKVGSYTGTGAAGNSVVTGFEPAFVMIKNTSGGDNWHRWYMYDNDRGGTNPLAANVTTLEPVTTNASIDFNSNGFTIAESSSHVSINQSGHTFIYLAIAADPDTTTPVVENSFDVVTYTGNGGTQDIDVAFKPDLVWIKSRDRGTSPYTGSHYLFDTIRGPLRRIKAESTDAESTFSNSLTSFNANGFSLGTGSNVNYNNDEFIAWCWKAGDHDDNLPQINTEGTTDSIVSVNDAAGFSIVKYSGSDSNATIGHGLSSPPEFIMVKNISSTNNWCGSSQYIGWDNIFGFDYTLQARDFDFFLDTTPTSQVFNVKGNIGLVNDAGEDYIAYCFTSITGYQKIGSYSGTGVDGNRIYTTDNGTSSGSGGFKPRWLLVKRTDAADNWVIVDTARGLDGSLFPDLSSQELSNSNVVSFNSDGFTVNGASGGWNNGSGTYFYLAIK